jgi:UDP-hydrolysing UDP-N-acetyl-D-glucosamine 2-epimerase
LTVRRVAIVTTSRADLSPLLPVMRAVDAHPGLALEVLATGMHLAPGHRASLADLESAGFAPAATIETIDGDSAAAVDAAIARGIDGFAARFAAAAPDILVVLGDRFDMFPAAVATIPFRIPLAHVHGGEVTEGAFDDQFRHAVSKIAHLHFVAAGEFAARLARMGEETWRITVCGAPGLDGLAAASDIGRDGIQSRTGIPAAAPFSLVTVHPETAAGPSPADQIAAFLAAADAVPGWLLITAPNADPGGAIFRSRIEAFCTENDRAVFLENAGPDLYPSLMRHAAAVVGNSSSGIIEAGFFGRPVVNIGERQAGRPAGENVVPVPWQADAIANAWREALGDEAHRRAASAASPYGRGDAGARIANVLAETPLGPRLLRKRFNDSSAEHGVAA